MYFFSLILPCIPFETFLESPSASAFSFTCIKMWENEQQLTWAEIWEMSSNVPWTMKSQEEAALESEIPAGPAVCS